MYVLIGKEKCNSCDTLKNVLDEKGIQYHYVDIMEMPHKTMTYLKMYCSSYPMVLGVIYFSKYLMTFDSLRRRRVFFSSFYFEDSLKVIPESRPYFTISLSSG
jgi:hypothetical protein